jgi:HK97 family phage major capsid protein
MPERDPNALALEDKELAVQIQKEITKLGDQVKDNFTELNKNYVKLKEIVDRSKDDSYDKNFIDKLVVDMSTRQETLDKKFKEQGEQAIQRLDNLEVAMKRTGSGDCNPNVKLYTKEQAEQFVSAILSLQSGGEKSVTINQVEDFLKANNDANFLGDYNSAFLKYIRQRGDGKNWHPNGGLLTAGESKAMLSASDPDGGIHVPVAMSNMIIKKVYESDIIRSLASVESITTSAMEWLADLDEASAGWETETVQGSEQNTPKWDKRRIGVHNMYYRARITQQLIEDAAINVENWLSSKAGEKMGRVEGVSFISGTGIGQPRGFLTYANGTTFGTIEQVNMGAAATLTADGFISVKFALLEDYLNRQSVAWVMNRSTVAAAMKMKYGDGTYIWKPSMIAGDPTSNILDIPVRMSPTMPTVSAGALAVALAAWKDAYMIVDRLGITVQRDPYTAKPFIEFYFRKRVGGDVLNFEAIKLGVIAV